MRASVSAFARSGSGEYAFDSLQHAHCVLARKLVLPDPQHTPALFSEFRGYPLVPRHVPRNFRTPVLLIARWHAAVLGTPVPKAPIHKQREFGFVENEIRTACEHNLSPPAEDSVLAQESHENEFSRLVPATPHGPHDHRAFHAGDCVSPSAHHTELTSVPKWRASASASNGGTAFPTWRSWSVSYPWKMKRSSKDCRRAASRTVMERLSR